METNCAIIKYLIQERLTVHKRLIVQRLFFSENHGHLQKEIVNAPLTDLAPKDNFSWVPNCFLGTPKCENKMFPKNEPVWANM